MAGKMTTIKLTELLEACLDFKRDATPENEARINVLIDQMIIRSYQPISQKQVNVALILGLLSEEEQHDVVAAATKITIGKAVLGVLGYVVNLDNDLDRASFVPGVADLLYEFGVIDAVLEHASKDYARFEAMLQEAMNFSNLFNLANTAALMSVESMEEFVKSVREFKTELTPEMLADLKAIAVAGSPEFQALKETLMDEALGTALESDFASLKPRSKEVKEEDTTPDSTDEGEGGSDAAA